MIPHISSTTARDRLPVAVSFSPPVSAALRSRRSALAVTADPEISESVSLGSRRIALLLAEGSSWRALKLSKSSIVQAGSTPFSHRRTSGLANIPGATICLKPPPQVLAPIGLAQYRSDSEAVRHQQSP